MNVAIIQNRIGVDGRSVVVSEVIRLCNQSGIVPVIFSFSPSRDGGVFRREYGSDLDFELCSVIGFPVTRGTAYQTPLLNVLVFPRVKEFDVVFNSGRCPYFLPKRPFYIHYVHFPVEASLREEEHFKSLRGFFYTFPLRILYFGRAKKVQDGLFLANSHYTAREIFRLYTSLDRNRVKVVHPPCSIQHDSKLARRDLDFVSLGSFISDKRQIEQLKIAQCLRQCNFSLIGGVKSKPYFRKCREFIRKCRLSNVKLYPDVSRETVCNLLSRARIYLHTKRNEHFGISTVEAIDHGCIPIVHDSGGSREMVPIEDLRFRNTEEAINKAGRLIKCYSEERDNILAELRRNIEQYSSEEFRSIVSSILFNKPIL